MREWKHISAFLAIPIVVCTSVENAAVFGVVFYDQVPIFTVGAFADVVLMDSVICHKIADFRLVRADPEVQPVVFIELVLQGKPTDWATKAKQVNHLHIDIPSVRKVEILDQLHQESGRPVFRRRNIDAVLGPCHSNVK